MATSGTYSFTVNRDQIIRLCLLRLQQIAEEEVPSAIEVSDLSLYLNMMVKQWMGRTDFAPGLKTWTRRYGHLYLSNATNQYLVPGIGWAPDPSIDATLSVNASSGAVSITITGLLGGSITLNGNIGIQLSNGSMQWTTVSSVAGSVIGLNAPLNASALSGAYVVFYQTTATQPIKIEDAGVCLRDIFNNDTPIEKMTAAQYDALPSKQNPIQNLSDPTRIYYEFQLGSSILRTDCGAAQDVSKHLVIPYFEAIQDFNNPTDNPEYPQEWLLPLALGLAGLVHSDYGYVWTPKDEQNLQMALASAKSKDPEINASYFESEADA